MSNYQPSEYRREYGLGFLATAIAGTAGYAASRPLSYLAASKYYEYNTGNPWPTNIEDFYNKNFYSLFEFIPDAFQPIEVINATKWWSEFAATESHSVYIYSGVAVAIVAAAAAAKWGFRKQKNEVVKEGLEAIKDPKEAFKYAKKKLDKAVRKLPDSEKICLHPGYRGDYRDAMFWPASAFSRHVFACGSSGCGKTQSIQYLMESTISDPEQLNIIFDFKGDFGSGIRAWMPEGMEPLRFAPWDTRSAQWAMYKDMRRFTDAEKIACSLIPFKPSSGDPYWTEAGRDIMSAVLTALNHQMPDGWGPQDLAAVFMSEPLLMQAIADYRPGAGKHIDGSGGQTQGVQGGLRQCGQNLDSLCRLWTGIDGVSLVDLVKQDPKKRKTNTIVIAGNLDHPWFYPVCAAMLSVLMSTVLTMPDSKNRKINFYCDEAGRIPRIEFLEPFMTAARSKGGRMLLAIQDYGKLVEQYGKELSDTIISQCSTKIYGRMNGGDTQKFAQEQFGNQVVERLSSTSQSGGNQNQAIGSDVDSAFGGNSNASTSWQRDERPVVIGNEFAALPPSEETGGPTMFCKIDGVDKILKLQWPYRAFPTVDEHTIEKPELYKLFDPETSALRLLEGDDNFGTPEPVLEPEKEVVHEAAHEVEHEAEPEQEQEQEAETFENIQNALFDELDASDENENEHEDDKASEKLAYAAAEVAVGGVSHIAEAADLLEEALGDSASSKKSKSSQHISKKGKKKNKGKGD